ncbi:Hsp20/alpha crystallin family protein (plasmid) [Bradyrhizobium sp. ISRA443]|uniref:Hsp20/alpha crystallin family protein n=1 Tax=unclassified Bradyrhizobium TaxID=2631580 RepID=UPI0024786E24|nr:MULTISPECIES: Hsp20/alpha crystallin family protein [unclassified Bradyrhizobium]WGS03032.1 Hsp20/alpha crystallin family protein [Bradyrhizobium sp. ISRA436]WGS09933.1 Hsp20/alpha crystallin family protein [Bradyrhizobium sp. ISRA437]WGS16818.1 Hsp20/alpha crystallin family protein [Bradyrhizobium sp. ISRA443]
MPNDTKRPVAKKASKAAFAGEVWRPFETRRQEVDRLFEGFGEESWRRPIQPLAAFERAWPRKFVANPAVDVAESDQADEFTAEMPEMDEKNIEVSLANGGITIKREKKEEKEEKSKDYYRSERRYGSFERFLDLPDGVDTGKIEATFKNGVLKVTLPKTAEAQKPAKKSEVRAAA